MTKRFTIKPSIIVDGFVIIDKEKEYTFPVLENTLNYMFCKALNELYEENQGLQSSNLEYEDALGRLEEINEQLKEQVGELKKEIVELSNGEADWIMEEYL